MKQGLIILMAVLLSACSSRVLLTIDSEPPGAAVYEGGKYWGQTPVTLSYAHSTQYREGGCMGTQPIKVEWNSGAQARVSTINVCSVQQDQQEFLFTYPEGFPGKGAAENTAQNEVKVPLKRVAPNGQLFWEVSHSESDNPLRCYSSVSGATVETNCS